MRFLSVDRGGGGGGGYFQPTTCTVMRVHTRVQRAGQ